jgi:hypothetical protein
MLRHVDKNLKRCLQGFYYNDDAKNAIKIFFLLKRKDEIIGSRLNYMALEHKRKRCSRKKCNATTCVKVNELGDFIFSEIVKNMK